MNGVELAARFSYIVNNLRYCGPPEAKDLFLRYFKDKDNEDEVVSALKKFEGTSPYFSSIAEKHEKDLLDFDVVEAYWVGNNLLDDFTKDDMKNVIVKLVSRGLPESLGNKLIENLPDDMFPHHNFNVFYVGVGQLTGAVPTTLQNMNNCRTAWGRVVKVYDNTLYVRSSQIEFKNNRYVVGTDKDLTVSYMKDLLPNVKSDDLVALHWGFAPLVLSEKQLDNLVKYTQKILDVLNRTS